MKNTYSTGNRRMIMSAEMLNAYQQYANRVSKNDEQECERINQKANDLNDQDDNAIYELGYN